MTWLAHDQETKKIAFSLARNLLKQKNSKFSEEKNRQRVALQVLFERDTRKAESSFPSGSRAFKGWPDTAKFGESGRNPGGLSALQFFTESGFFPGRCKRK